MEDREPKVWHGYLGSEQKDQHLGFGRASEAQLMMKAKEDQEAKRRMIGWRTPTMDFGFVEVGREKKTGFERGVLEGVAVVLTGPVET